MVIIFPQLEKRYINFMSKCIISVCLLVRDAKSGVHGYVVWMNHCGSLEG